jgi:ribosomal protein S18 acetylase RimI-like enzyme
VNLVVVRVPPSDDEHLVAVLRDAEEDDQLVRAALRDPDNQSYAATMDGLVVGAAVVRWRRDADSEIVYIGVDEAHRGRGHGRRILAHLVDELPEHGHRLVVGTANSSLDNIAFYQRCGFRMDAVRRNHFAYVEPPVSEFGIPMLDMIVFSYAPPSGTDRAEGRGSARTPG